VKYAEVVDAFKFQVGGIGIRMEYLRCRGTTLRYLCDAFHLDRQTSALWVWDRENNRLGRSDDYGESWRFFESQALTGAPVSAIALSADEIICLLEDRKLVRFDPNNSLEYQLPADVFAWHGSWGGDVDDSGGLMFAEYQTDDAWPPVPISVWRLDKDGNVPYRVLSRIAGRQPPKGEIRHFHTCCYLSEHGLWLVSSGDIGIHNRVWISKDGKSDWVECRIAVKGELAELEGLEQLLRFTSLQEHCGQIIWLTDDDLDGLGPCFVEARLVGETLQLSPRRLFGANLLRNLVRVPGQGYLGISEAKKKSQGPEVYFIDLEGNIDGPVELPGVHGKSCPFTKSVGSRCFQNGVCFTPHLGKVVFSGRGGLIRWRLEGI